MHVPRHQDELGASASGSGAAVLHRRPAEPVHPGTALSELVAPCTGLAPVTGVRSGWPGVA